MKNYILSSILVLLVIASNAQTISGRIVDQNSSKPISDVVISVTNSPINGLSDGDGKFIIQGLSKGTFTLIFSKIGYQNYQETLNLPLLAAMDIRMNVKAYDLDEMNVNTTRANNKSAMAYSTLTKTEIEKSNLGQDIPYLLQFLPSVVSTSDAGTGIGYTGIRIRGSDATRVNVTINGIPLNDAESQGVFWVNLPDFASSTENIQVQRGVGTSSNGAGSFGGSINLLSNKFSSEPYGETSNSFGSFNTIKNNVSFGSGLLNKHFAIEGRLSRIKSDGYIDRGTSDLKSYYLSAGYVDSKTSIRFNAFSGKEITYQSWYGTPEARFKNDAQGMQDFIDRNYLDDKAAANLLNSGRTYNFYTYDNQVDNYQQDHYQLINSRTLGKDWIANLSFHYTKGRGYFEEYREEDALSVYSIAPVIVGQDTFSTSDIIRRRWLDNDFYGATFNIQGSVNKQLKLIIGVATNKYEGGHFGEVIWARTAGSSDIRIRYYDNTANKTDANAFVKGEYSLLNDKLVLFGDLQARNVQYNFIGVNDDGTAAPQDDELLFFNPKVGVTYLLDKHQSVYGSYSIGNKEPNRDDYTQSGVKSRPRHENLQDVEVGYNYQSQKYIAKINFYHMQYKDQLVLTGQVNDVGNYTRTNIENSYRTGIEIEGAVKINKALSIDVNTTISENKIKSFTEFTDIYDEFFNYVGQQENTFKNTIIGFSPTVISAARISFKAFSNLEFQLIGKYVGSQYLDNTTNGNRKLDAYTTCDFRVSYTIKQKVFKEITINGMLNNFLSENYASNGYSFGYIVDQTRIQENFVYPQALVNGLVQVTVKF
jgi:iron complex outermembrane receptor protein